MKKRILLVFIGVILSIFTLYFLFFFVFDYLKIPCFFHQITNLYCPGCGMTRAIRCLLQFEFIKAINYNVLIIILIPFGLFYVFSFFKTYIKTGNIISISQMFSRRLLWGLLILVILFGVIRNFSLFSFFRP